ncbi:MAG TPA: hypothetical protein VK461_02945 [Acidimicrobiales bacterium]|nr:hypothetical protein [Acidimicrobiales bacterium]
MANQSIPAREDPRDLLSTTQDLSRRVRLAQRGAWFPLLVFAAITLAAIPFTRYGGLARHCSAVHGDGYVCLVQSALALWYWPIAVVAGYLLITWFYVHRSAQRGVGTSVRPYVVVGVVLAALVGAWAFWADVHPAFLAEVLSRQEPNRVLYRLATPAGVIGLALLLLAWIERSWTLFGLTIAYLVVAVSTVGVDWYSHPTPWAFLPHVAIDGAVLLIAGVIVAFAHRTDGPTRA